MGHFQPVQRDLTQAIKKDLILHTLVASNRSTLIINNFRTRATLLTLAATSTSSSNQVATFPRRHQISLGLNHKTYWREITNN